MTKEKIYLVAIEWTDDYSFEPLYYYESQENADAKAAELESKRKEFVATLKEWRILFNNACSEWKSLNPPPPNPGKKPILWSNEKWEATDEYIAYRKWNKDFYAMCDDFKSLHPEPFMEGIECYVDNGMKFFVMEVPHG